MTPFEWFGILTGVATLMGTGIGVYAHFNNKVLKAGFGQMHEEMSAGFARMHEEMKMGFGQMHEDLKQQRDDMRLGFRVLGLLIIERDDARRAELLTKLFPSPS